MDKTINKYNNFTENENTNWKSRFTWCGMDGKTPKHTTSIPKFISKTDITPYFGKSNNVNDLFTNTAKLADAYVNWVKEQGTPYKANEYEDMKEFFKGAIGEFFFYHLLTDVKCLMIPMPSSNNEFKRFDFNYVSPTLKEDKDFGIDLTAIANDIPIVLQVKFWNPYSKEPMKIDIIQKADSEGTRNGFIKQEDDDNIFVCWLNSEERGKRWVNENKVYKNKVVIIGKKTLEASINNRNNIFWDNFYESVLNIKEMA